METELVPESRQVKEEVRAEAMFGLIEKRYRGNKEKLSELQFARYSIILALRSENESIFSIRSDELAYTYEYYHPPLIGLFRQSADDTIRIIDYREIE